LEKRKVSIKINETRIFCPDYFFAETIDMICNLLLDGDFVNFVSTTDPLKQQNLTKGQFLRQQKQYKQFGDYLFFDYVEKELVSGSHAKIVCDLNFTKQKKIRRNVYIYFTGVQNRFRFELTEENY